MSGSGKNLRDQAVRVLVTIGDMFPSSRVAKKLEADDDATFESLIAVWMSGLAGMTDEKVARGLKVLMASGNTFEPSVPEFVKMCKPGPASHQRYRSLPAPKQSDAPASIDHYHPSIQKQLTKIGILPRPGETKHQYAMRCKDYTMASRHAGVIGPG
jgi:hypothetical protein